MYPSVDNESTAIKRPTFNSLHLNGDLFPDRYITSLETGSQPVTDIFHFVVYDGDNNRLDNQMCTITITSAPRQPPLVTVRSGIKVDVPYKPLIFMLNLVWGQQRLIILFWANSDLMGPVHQHVWMIPEQRGKGCWFSPWALQAARYWMCRCVWCITSAWTWAWMGEHRYEHSPFSSSVYFIALSAQSKS